MVIYEYRCPHGCLIAQRFPMGEAPSELRCEVHDIPARKLLARGEHIAFPGSYRYDHRSPR